ncbi:MAG: hypothetical protein WCJ93_08755 [Methanomicrobiales archaeon]
MRIIGVAVIICFLAVIAAPVLASPTDQGLKSKPLNGDGNGIRMPGLPDRASNLTAYISGKGYDVDSLNAALSDAKAAVLASDKDRFQSAMKAFARELRVKVKDGSIDKEDLKSYAKDHKKTLRLIHAIKLKRQHTAANLSINRL